MARYTKNREKNTGAASLEAVMVLPIFLLIFAGVLYVERLSETKQRALVEARRCAWQYADAGCDPKKIPEGCEDVLQYAAGLSDDNALTDNESGGVLDGLEDIPFIGPFIEGLFGNALTARANRNIRKPPILGQETVSINGYYYLMCNEKKLDILDVVTSAFCGTVGSQLGCP
jgi:hypothetical protein